MDAASAALPFYCADPQSLETCLEEQIRRHQLWSGITRLGLAVSGGADSVALFHMLAPRCRAAGISVTLLHLNHGLRPEADREERFVRSLATGAGLPLITRQARLSSRPSDGRSLEMAARDARMAFFRESLTEADLDAVATGHQADDVAETLLLRLARGAGTTGLSGLRPRSETSAGLLLRPLLALSGTALRAWLRERGLEWCEDSSNRDGEIPRNFIRNTLLPQLERTWRPDLRVQLCRSADLLREDDALLEHLAASQLVALSGNGEDGRPEALPVQALLRQPVALQRRILRLWLFRNKCPLAAGLSCVQAILSRCGEPGEWSRTLPGHTRAVCRDGTLALEAPRSRCAAQPPLLLCGPFPRTLRWGNLEIAAETDHGLFTCANGIGTYPAACSLSAASLEGGRVEVRARLPGDRIAPTGMQGSKKIQDLFVDEKVPEQVRDAIPLVVCDEAVVWVPGYRVARRFAVPAPGAPSLRITITQAVPRGSSGRDIRTLSA